MFSNNLYSIQPASVNAGLVRETLLEFERVVHDPALVNHLSQAQYDTHPSDLNAVFDIKTPSQETRSGDNKFVWHYGDRTRQVLISRGLMCREIARLIDLSEAVYEAGRIAVRPFLRELGGLVAVERMENDVLDPSRDEMRLWANNHLRLIAYMGESRAPEAGLVDSGLPDLASPHYDLSILSFEHGASRHGFYIVENGVVRRVDLAPGDAVVFAGLGLAKYIEHTSGLLAPAPPALGHGAAAGGQSVFEHRYPDTVRLTAVQFFSTLSSIAPISSSVEEARGHNAALRSKQLGLYVG